MNAPLSDTLAARLSLALNTGDGYVTNRLNPGKDLNNANESAGRLQLRWTPSDSLDVLFNARYGHQQIRTGFFEYASAVLPTGDYTPGVPNVDLGGYVDTDNDNFAGDYDFTGHNRTNTRGYTGRVDWDLGEFATLTSITDFQHVERDYIEDSDASPANYFNFFLTTNAKQFSQETRLAGDFGDAKWVVGAYYLDIDINDSNGGKTTELFEALFGAPVSMLGFNGVRNPYTINTKSWSLFGQFEYPLTDQLTFIGGVRYINEKKSDQYNDFIALFPEDLSGGLDPRIVDVADAVAPFSDSRHDKNVAARVQLNYTPADNVLLYASWNRGVKSGGYNAPLLPTDIYVTREFLTYDPEQLDAYEVGVKLGLGPVRVNASGYYYDYKRCQAFSIIGLDTFTLNANCKNKGAEVEIEGSLFEGFDTHFGVSYIDAKVTDIPGVTIDANTPAGVVPAILPGAEQRPVQSPKWNLNGLARYETSIGGLGSLAFQVSGQYRSEVFFALTNFRASRQGGYFLGDASVTWILPGDRVSIRGWVQNMFDRNYLVQTFDLSGNLTNGGLFGLVEQYYGRPRMYGVTLSTTF
ncbi:MAG: TonB-dependent receptor [Parvularculaceae bacterium]